MNSQTPLRISQILLFRNIITNERCPFYFLSFIYTILFTMNSLSFMEKLMEIHKATRIVREKSEKEAC
jgi:hypothetical protein